MHLLYTWVNVLSYLQPLAIVNTISGYKDNKPTLSTYYFLRMQSYSSGTRNHEWMCRRSDIHRHTPSLNPCFPLFLSVFPPLSHPDTHTHTEEKQREGERERDRERKQHRDRARRRTGKGNSCAVLPLHSFLLGWSFPSGGERDCKLSKRTVRKQEAPSSSRESEMKSICGPCSPGRLGAIVREAVCAAISFLWTRRLPLPKAFLLSGHRLSRQTKHQGQNRHSRKVGKSFNSSYC